MIQKRLERPVKSAPVPCSPETPCIVCGGINRPCYTRGQEVWCNFIGTDEIAEFTPVGYEWIGTAPSKQQVFMPVVLAKAREERIHADPQETEAAKDDSSEIIQAEDGDRTPRLVKEYELLKQSLGDRLRLNSFTQEIELDGKPIVLDRIRLELAVNHRICLKSGREDIQDMVCLLAESNQYSPVLEYLESCYQQYGSDTKILESIAERYFGQTASIYNAFVVRTLIGAVARVYEPGSKMDTALILQGPQGYLKSSWFKILCGPQWFDDSLGAISDKDERLKLHRAWFVEWAELETVFSRKDVAATKAFLTSSTDHLRPPYGRSIQSMPRHSIIVGTTNKDEFLSDPTGNRRFWVIPCTQQINLKLLEAERDRIWAAAVALYKAGEPCYLSPGEELNARAIAEEFQTRDPWQELILAYVSDRDVVTTKEILSDLLKIEPGRQDKGQLMRVADILRGMGWQKNFGWYQSRRQKIWLAPDPPQEPPDPPKNEVEQKVDLASNRHQTGILTNPDPPVPPPRQHLPILGNGNGHQSETATFTTFFKTGGTGGSGGSELSRANLLVDPPPDPPPQFQIEVDQKTRNLNSGVRDIW